MSLGDSIKYLQQVRMDTNIQLSQRTHFRRKDAAVMDHK
jgi:hypothetical protein